MTLNQSPKQTPQEVFKQNENLICVKHRYENATARLFYQSPVTLELAPEISVPVFKRSWLNNYLRKTSLPECHSHGADPMGQETGAEQSAGARHVLQHWRAGHTHR